MRSKSVLTFAVALLFAVSATAATLAPVTDSQLVGRADAIVTGTVISHSSSMEKSGYIVTTYRVRVEEAIKGSSAAGEIIEITEFGGVLPDGRFVAIAGSAEYRDGERVLAFLRQRGDDGFFTAAMTRGKLTYSRSEDGRELLTRDNGCSIAAGTHAHSSIQTFEADSFVAFVRDTVAGRPAAVPMSSGVRAASLEPENNGAGQYCMTSGGTPVRWPFQPGGSVGYLVNGTQPGVTNTAGSVGAALGTWSGAQGSNITLTNDGTSTTTTATPFDGKNMILLGSNGSTSEYDPNNDLCDAGIACGVVSGNSSHTFAGEGFLSISTCDIIIRPTVTGSTALETALTHELGHTIGLRHSDPSPAVMRSNIDLNWGADLQLWDIQAVSTVYGAGPPCEPPAGLNVSGNTNPFSGQPTTLFVNATGTAPLQYQWYEVTGAGSTSIPGANGPSFTTPPITAPKTYYVKVGNNCGLVASAQVTVSPAECTAPGLTRDLESSSIVIGKSVTLTTGAVGTTPISFQWYQGALGDQSKPFGTNSNSVIVTPTQTTKYWVRASNPCGFADSNEATITVTAQCVPATVAGPGDATVLAGTGTTLTVVAGGTGPFTYQWFRGASGDTTNPVAGANSASFVVPAITQGSVQYWARVTGQCGTANSRTATVSVPCSKPEVPTLYVPAAANAVSPFVISWTDSEGARFEVQEANNASFNSPRTFMVEANKSLEIPAHTEVQNGVAKLFYRVRAFSGCNGPEGTPLVSEFSAPAQMFVQAPVEVCASGIGRFSTNHVGLNSPIRCSLAPSASGKTALAENYTVTSDQPWLTVDKPSGQIPPGGLSLNLTADTTNLPEGATTATLTITRTTVQGKNAMAGPTVSIPVTVSLVTPVAPQPRETSPEALLIPAVAYAAGANNSQFQSDVRLTNTTQNPIRYELSYTPTRSSGPNMSTLLTLQGGDTRALDDIVRAWFGSGFEGSALGTLQIRPQSTSAPGGTPSTTRTTVASSRTYNAAANGTFGQFIPAVPFSSFIGNFLTDPNAKLSLQQIAASASYRTNVGFVEGSGQQAQIVATLFDNLGQKVEEVGFTLAPFEHRQDNMATLFSLGNRAVNDGRIEVRVTSDTGKVSAYASVLDNKTSDPLLVFPVQTSKIAANRFVVPGVAELVRSDANFHTDMRIFNGGNAPVVVTLNYSPQPGSPAASGPVQFTIGAKQIKAVDDVLPTLWNLTGGGAVSVSTPNDSEVVVTARTYSRQADNGTYGQFIPAVNAKQAVGLGEDPLEVVQLEESVAFRSNVGIVEVTGNPVEIEIAAWRPESKIAARTAVTLQPNEFRQLNQIFKQFGMPTVYNGRVSVKVLNGTGRVSTYGSVVDNRTLDPTYIPAQ